MGPTKILDSVKIVLHVTRGAVYRNTVDVPGPAREGGQGTPPKTGPPSPTRGRRT